jgi:hypothetical protein
LGVGASRQLPGVYRTSNQCSRHGSSWPWTADLRIAASRRVSYSGHQINVVGTAAREPYAALSLRSLRSIQVSATIGDRRSLGCVIVFSLNRGRPSSISNHGNLELTHWWKVGRTRAGSSKRPMAIDSRSRSPISKQTPPRQDAQIIPLTKTLPRLRDEFSAEQGECGPWNMNKREYWCSRLLPASVAVAVASIEHVSDHETHRIAGTSTSQEDSHLGLHQKLFYQVPSCRNLAGLSGKRPLLTLCGPSPPVEL